MLSFNFLVRWLMGVVLLGAFLSPSLVFSQKNKISKAQQKACEQMLKGKNSRPVFTPVSNIALSDIAFVLHTINTDIRNHFGQPPIERRIEPEILKRYLEQDLILDPKAQWQSWKATRLEQGWKYGKTQDEEKKTHPDLVEKYEDLEFSEKVKNYTFYAVVKSIQEYIKLQQRRRWRRVDLQLNKQPLNHAPKAYAGGTYLLLDMAAMAHEVNNDVRAYLGQPRSGANISSESVEATVKNDLDPEASWKAWKATRRKQGWKYDPTYDAKKKLHPNLIRSYNKLPEAERIKDYTYYAAVNALWLFWLTQKKEVLAERVEYSSPERSYHTPTSFAKALFKKDSIWDENKTNWGYMP